MINYKNRMMLPSFNQLMLHREIIAVCFAILTTHTNAVCGQNVELLIVKQKKKRI
jgi:hypothetical protein